MGRKSAETSARSGRACAAAIEKEAKAQGLPARVAYVEGDNLLARAEALGAAFVGSLTMGSGQKIIFSNAFDIWPDLHLFSSNKIDLALPESPGRRQSNMLCAHFILSSSTGLYPILRLNRPISGQQQEKRQSV